ncbi:MULTISPECIES: hypothetical protein [Brevundimonas]|uniref:hypothetical protein n=1 Tax=Brevundimonas TaxID=41275 RepID=UPI0019086436|nr:MULTISPECIES: hypothetical protein [Brevundimonas]MDA0742800.1 hypothetical protein [Pseudomonadota bacterium]MBK1970782.1 hypothetical protein [Brevundimonas diminuta]MBK1974272.1 hypothetical protein [Brevundimonas diminuta]MDA1321855.1 hypothetical protein [Pseudomonadota bacterium]MDM8353370.1 hypothetical protein [Brevundimonas diminuta]
MGPDDGTFLGTDGHGNWNKFQSARGGNPTELIVYSSALKGRAQGLNGSDTIQRINGAAFTSIQVGDAFYFAGRKRRFLESLLPIGWQ